MTTTQSSDVTAKRPSETDSLAAEGEAASSLMKKPRVEEEDDANMEDESESESDSDEEVDPETLAKYEAEAKAKAEAEGRVRVGTYVRFSYVPEPEPEPEWDVDSFDGREYVSDPESRSYFANDNDYLEFRNDRIQALKNRGFLPDPVKYIFPILDMEKPGCRNMTTGEYLADLASLCVKKLNEEKGKTVEFVSVVRSNISGGGRWKLYITFMAREYPNGPLVEYQAKAMDFAGGSRPPFPILCRPAPNP